MTINVYLDESGDLGWKFTRPYRRGGSSRYLTIAYLKCPPNKKHYLKRIVKAVYSQCGFNPNHEVKGSDLTNNQKELVARKISNLLNSHTDITITSITVRKENVQTHIRTDVNKIYNYMIKLSLIDKIACYDTVNLIRDIRSIKVKSGNCLADYLQIALWFEKSVPTKIIDNPYESHKVQNLILADWLNNIIWGCYEDRNSNAFDIISNKLDRIELFF